MAAACLRYVPDLRLIEELRNLAPECVVELGARRIVLRFRGSKTANAFLADIAEDPDLEEPLRKWVYDAVLDPEEPRLRLCCGIPPADLPAVVSCLRHMRHGLRSEDPAVGLRPAPGVGPEHEG